MALINCPECSKEVSDSAPSCPNCGYPLASKTSTSETDIRTIQKTSKQFKLITAAAVICMIVGLIWFIIDFKNFQASGGPKLMGPILMAIGLAAYIINKILIWWHHD